LSQVAGVHEAHLTRTFRRHLGESPGGYQRRLRVERARLAIEASGDSLVEIAPAGFPSQSTSPACSAALGPARPTASPAAPDQARFAPSRSDPRKPGWRRPGPPGPRLRPGESMSSRSAHHGALLLVWFSAAADRARRREATGPSSSDTDARFAKAIDDYVVPGRPTTSPVNCWWRATARSWWSGSTDTPTGS
jgi:hypothetical protein